MHNPLSEPLPSVYYHYKVYPYRSAKGTGPERVDKTVLIAGAGPIGLLTALDLARFGVRSIVLEQERQVCHGSRAVVLTRRSLEILQQIGAHEPFLQKGLPWSRGRSFYRGREIYEMRMPHEADDRFLPCLNLQQQFIEEYLVDFCERTGLVELRWGHKITSVSQTAELVTVGIDTADGLYELQGEWLVAADGGRSTLRRLLDLRMEGRSYPGNFVIADIKAHLDLPTERLCYFDPAWNPGNNVLVHREPDDIWRIDFRLPEGETPEQALEPGLLHQRIASALQMINQPVDWQLDWATVYSANTLTLPDYVIGRILFTGDAAHLLPIFGVRGANTGIQDADNLAWKLAFVVNGWAPPRLLDTYTEERVQAAREICEEAGRSTRFMTPPTSGARLLRDAVLSFCMSEDFLKDLLHWRTSRPHTYRQSSLNSFSAADAQFSGGFACGDPIKNVRLSENDYLFDRLGAHAAFRLLAFAGSGGPSKELSDVLAAACDVPFPLIRIVVGVPETVSSRYAELVLTDVEGRVASKFDAAPGTVYLLRPDMHVCARWRHTDSGQIRQALLNARANP